MDLNNYGLNINTVVTIIAMQEELDLIINSQNYSIDELFTNLHQNILVSYKKEYKHNDKIVNSYIISGSEDKLHKLSKVGCETAALLTYLAIQHYKPNLVLNCGYAGSSGLVHYNLGDLILSKGYGCYYDREMIFQSHKDIAFGKYPVFNCEELNKKLNFHLGIIGTTDSFKSCDKGLSKSLGLSCVEMEFAAISRICYNMNVPVIGLKIISDTHTLEEDEIEKKIENSIDDKRKSEFEFSVKELPSTIYNGYMKLFNLVCFNLVQS